MTSHEIAIGALLSENTQLRAALDVSMAESDRWRELAQQAQADYAMLRAVARMCFSENGSEQSMLNLWNLAVSVEHPGVALIIRYNRAKAVVEAARSHDWGNIGDALFAHDAPLKEGGSS